MHGSRMNLGRLGGAGCSVGIISLDWVSLWPQGCSTLWNAEEVEEAIEAADGGAEAVLGE